MQSHVICVPFTTVDRRLAFAPLTSLPCEERTSTKPTSRDIPRPAVEQMAESPAHPGEVLREDFLVPIGITQTAFAARLGECTVSRTACRSDRR